MIDLFLICPTPPNLKVVSPPHFLHHDLPVQQGPLPQHRTAPPHCHPVSRSAHCARSRVQRVHLGGLWENWIKSANSALSGSKVQKYLRTLTTVCVQAMGELIGGPTDVHLCAVLQSYCTLTNMTSPRFGIRAGGGSSTEEHFTQLGAWCLCCSLLQWQPASQQAADNLKLDFRVQNTTSGTPAHRAICAAAVRGWHNVILAPLKRHDPQNLDQDFGEIGICTHFCPNAAINSKLYWGKEKCTISFMETDGLCWNIIQTNK